MVIHYLDISFKNIVVHGKFQMIIDKLAGHPFHG